MASGEHVFEQLEAFRVVVRRKGDCRSSSRSRVSFAVFIMPKMSHIATPVLTEGIEGSTKEGVFSQTRLRLKAELGALSKPLCMLAVAD